ncbi:PREDICTED: C-type lectin domain family 2 member D-like [Nanorana parkeri]|uniref:C-type lectin domain family 2 member D-like n=1 Tax=Nanorana parkeri TaxID=125878 RepID=UPI00085480AF|nr:PREDICTED: C-type lectin domain family 2 member D-like [Nanorana parkeri]
MGDAITYSEMNFTKKHNSRILSGSVQKEDVVTYAAVKNQPREEKKTTKSNKTQQVSPQADDVSLLYALVNKPKKAAEKSNKKVAKTEEVSPKEEDKGFMYTAINKLNKSAQKDNKTQQGRRHAILLVCALIVICVSLLITAISLGATCGKDKNSTNDPHQSNTSLGRPPRCPDLWITINDTCYLFSEIQKSRTESAKDCEERGSSLATVKEETIRRLVTITGKEFWVGLTRYYNHGETWTGRWADGSTETVSEGTGSCAKLGSRLILESQYKKLHWICDRKAV